LQAHLDNSIVHLTCIIGVPPSIVDYKQWKDMFAITNSAYCLTSSSTFINSYIPAEAGHVRTLSIKYLKTCFHLTISYDRGTTKFPHSVYTIHFTTLKGQSFLIEGNNATAESATGEYILQALLNMMKLVGQLHFSRIASDSAGNMKLAQQLVCAAVPTIIPMADVCYHLNLLCKDLLQLSMFTTVIKHIRAIVSFSARLEGIGKTQFATICALAISVQWCLPALRELINNPQKFKFPPKASMVDLLKKHSHAGTLFELDLNHLVKVQSPIEKSIICLESSQSDLSDVYKFLLAIMSMLKQLFDDSSHGFTKEEKKQIHAVVNKCFCEIIQEGPADCYIAAFFLDSHKSPSNCMSPSLNPLTPTITIPSPIPCTPEETVPNQRVFGHVMKYLKTVIKPEWKSKDNPMLKGLTHLQVQESFVCQLHCYACLQYPFDAPVKAGQSILSWWTHLTWIPEGAVLACITQKIFSVKPNDMPEKCTMSIFTQMNSALRNHQQVQILADMMQIRQWHM
ncbi:hypothetical protein BDR06DRAFT_835502, partial [Suillus hirtellus]